MSSRAIRNLRGDHGIIPTAPHVEEESTDDEDEDHSAHGSADDDDEPSSARNKPSLLSKGFAAILDDDSEESSSVSDRKDDEEDERRIKAADAGASDPSPAAKSPPELLLGDNNDNNGEREEGGGEDLDALLSEFQEKDAQQRQHEKGADAPEDDQRQQKRQYFSLVLEGIDVRDLDFDYSTRASLFGGDGDDNESPVRTSPVRPGRGKRQQFFFGPTRDGWRRPPHYVAGGMGMTTYDQPDARRLIPWPYSDPELVGVVDGEDSSWTADDRWYTFIHSDSYRRDFNDFVRIQQTGDTNALVMFVAHHPYITEALLQLSSVLYQTNHSQEGLELLRRCLWVFESASLVSFGRDVLDGQSVFVDIDQVENAGFFKALFNLVQVSNIAALPKTAFAVSRFILSLDPLRDPWGVLLCVDNFALASNSTSADKWIIKVVESGKINVCYRDEDSEKKVHTCGLLSLPNWAYSYALALFRRSEDDDSEGGAKSRADETLQNAISQFPSAVGLLLEENDVDTSGRSFRRDWMPVMDYISNRSRALQNAWLSAGSLDPVETSATIQATELIVRIFVLQNGRNWAHDKTLQWLYDNLNEQRTRNPDLPGPPSPALMRYAGSNPADYDNKIQQLPPDMNVLDPNLLAYAMAIDPNRPRFLRGGHRAAFEDQLGGGMRQDGGDGGGWTVPAPRGEIFGPPTNDVNPDWPLLEVFWRSFLPWNRVVGVPPPRR